MKLKTMKEIFLAIDITIEENRVTIVNIYGPNFDNPCFYEKFRDIFFNLDNDYFILCGDFNLVLNPLLDTENYSNVNNPKARDKVLELMKDLQLVDYYRILSPSKNVFT